MSGSQNPQEDTQVYFCNIHKCCKGSINVTFSHESGLGIAVKVKCSGCGEEADITDVSKW